MNQKPNLAERLKNKNLLWFAGFLLILLGIFGIGYGIFICYNGFLIRDTNNDAILDLLNNSMLTTQEGMNALLTFGIIIIIYYLLNIGLGFVGMLSSEHLIIRQTLFWLCIILLSFAIIFRFLGIFDINFTIINIVALSLFGIALVRKYNKDLSTLNKRRKK